MDLPAPQQKIIQVRPLMKSASFPQFLKCSRYIPEATEMVQMVFVPEKKDEKKQDPIPHDEDIVYDDPIYIGVPPSPYINKSAVLDSLASGRKFPIYCSPTIVIPSLIITANSPSTSFAFVPALKSHSFRQGFATLNKLVFNDNDKISCVADEEIDLAFEKCLQHNVLNIREVLFDVENADGWEAFRNFTKHQSIENVCVSKKCTLGCLLPLKKVPTVKIGKLPFLDVVGVMRLLRSIEKNGENNVKNWELGVKIGSTILKKEIMKVFAAETTITGKKWDMEIVLNFEMKKVRVHFVGDHRAQYFSLTIRVEAVSNN